MRKVYGLTNRIAAMLLSGMLVVGSVPGTVLASDIQTDIGQTSETAAEEMVEISELEAKKRGFSVSSEAKEKIAVICESSSDSKDVGNGRFCRNLIEGAIFNYASRVYGNTEGTACKDFTLYENDIVIPDTFENSESKSPIGFQI